MATKGQVFGKYELHTKIATTVLGEVWAGREQGAGMLAKDVAIKILSPQVSADPQFVEMYLAEARRSAPLTHQHVAQTHDLNKHGDSYYVVTELVPGETLSAVLNETQKQRAAIPARLAITLAFQACQALHDAHARTDNLGRPLGIVHKGVGPHNMIVGFGGILKVTDVGTAGVITQTHNLRSSIDPVKYAYMSPEQCMNTPVDLRTDVFSLGIVLWELLAGRRLHQGDNEFAIKQAVSLTQPDPLTGFRGDVSPSLNSAIMRALAKNPADRWQSAADFGRALQNALAPLGGPMPPKDVAAFMSRLFPQRLAFWQSVVGGGGGGGAAASAGAAAAAAKAAAAAAAAARPRRATDNAQKPAFKATAPPAALDDGDDDLSFDDDDDDDIAFGGEGLAEATLTDFELPAGLADGDPALAELVPSANVPQPGPAEATLDESAADAMAGGTLDFGLSAPSPLAVESPADTTAPEPAAGMFGPGQDANATIDHPAPVSPDETIPESAMGAGILEQAIKRFTEPSQPTFQVDVPEPVSQAPVPAPAPAPAPVAAAPAPAPEPAPAPAPVAAAAPAPAPEPAPVDMVERPDTGAPEPAPTPVARDDYKRPNSPPLRVVPDGYEPDPWLEDPDEEPALVPEFRVESLVDEAPSSKKQKLGPPVAEVLRSRAGHLVGSSTLRKKGKSFAPKHADVAVSMVGPDSASVQIGAASSGQIIRATGASEAASPNTTVVLRLGDRATLTTGDESWIVRVVRPPERPKGIEFEISIMEMAVALVLASIFVGGMALVVNKAEESGVLVKVEKPQKEKFADARKRKIRSLKPKKKKPKIKIKKIKPKKRPKKKVAKKAPKPKPKPPEPKPEIKPPDPTEARPKITNKQRAKIAKISKDKYAGKTKKEKVKTMFKTPNQGAATTFKTATTSIQSVKAKSKSGAFRVAGDATHVPGGEVRMALDAGAGGKGPVTKGGPAATGGVPKLAARAKPKKVRGAVRGLRAAARVSGTLSKSEVLKVIGKYMGAIRRCYEKQLMAKPSLSGKITAQWTITSGGRVSGARQKTSSLGNAKVSSCVLKVIRRMKFPKPKGGSVKITYPFIFRSAG